MKTNENKAHDCVSTNYIQVNKTDDYDQGCCTDNENSESVSKSYEDKGCCNENSGSVKRTYHNGRTVFYKNNPESINKTEDFNEDEVLQKKYKAQYSNQRSQKEKESSLNAILRAHINDIKEQITNLPRTDTLKVDHMYFSQRVMFLAEKLSKAIMMLNPSVDHEPMKKEYCEKIQYDNRMEFNEFSNKNFDRFIDKEFYHDDYSK